MIFSKLAKNTIRSIHNKQKAGIFFIKKDIFIDPESKKIRISELSPYLLGGLVGVSWVFILYFWYTSEDRMRIRAQQYLDQNSGMSQFKSADAEKPEEYRQEYIDKQKRKYKQLVDSRKKDEFQQKQLYEDYQKFVANDQKEDD
ncbi:hypothetical protein ABPG74_022464 [Tetrahymena malaccensis]